MKKGKRLLAGVCAFAMMLGAASVLPERVTKLGASIETSAEKTVSGADTVTTAFSGAGYGTENNPYQITSASELMEIENNPNSFYVLNNDIDLSSYNGGVWNGICDESNPFTGVFDGHNHTISNLNFDRINIGLFNATCGCSIKNLVLKTSSIYFSYSGGTVYDSENDYYDYDESLDNYSSNADGYYIGSLIGIDLMNNESENTTIDNCNIEATINIKSTCRRSRTHYVGGFIGCVEGYYENELIFSDCKLKGNVSFYSVPTESGSKNYIGGLVGNTNSSLICDDISVLSNISSLVNPTAITTYAGGISGGAGYFESSNCSIKGDIIADCTDESWISDSSHWSYSGGLSGKVSDYSVFNSRVNGKIYNNSEYGTGHAGGLFGQCNSGDIISCSYNGNISNYCLRIGADAYAGGLCGEALDITIDDFKTNNTIYNRGYYWGEIYTGGIVGKCNYFFIKNYEVTTKLTPCAYDGAGASSYAGGLVGYASDVYLEETPVDVSIDNSSKGIHNYSSEKLNNNYVGYAFNYSNNIDDDSSFLDFPTTYGISFLPSNGDLGGFKGRTDYSFKTEDVSSRFYSHINYWNRWNILCQSLCEWNGSCYGLSMSIGLNYVDLASCKNMSKTNEKIYPYLPLPYSDDMFDDIINYYQLSQYLDRDSIIVAKSFHVSLFGSEDVRKITEFIVLQSMITDAPFILEIGYKDNVKDEVKDVGHALLVLGNNFNQETQNYELYVYDVNTRMVMTYTISSDFSSFDFGEHGIYEHLTQDNYRYLVVTKITDKAALEQANILLDDDLKKIKAEILQSNTNANEDENSSSSTDVFYQLDSNKDIKITSENGEYFELKDGMLSGTLEYLDLDIIENEGGGIYKVKFPAGNYTLTSLDDSINVSVLSDNGFAALEGEGIDSAKIDLANGIDICGSNYTFEASVARSENTEMPLVTVSGQAEKDLSIIKNGDDVSVRTEGKVTDVTLNSTDGVNENENTYPSLNGDFDLKPDEAEVETSTVPGDADGNGVCNMQDYALLQRFLAGWDVEIDKDACDLNGDGEVNMLDYALFQRKLAGWDITA